MNENVRMIAERIRELRDLNGVSLESLARDFGIDPETYRGYENGETDIPIGFLYQLAQRFGMDMTALLTGEGPRLRKFSVVRKGKGLAVDRRKEYRYLDLSYNFIDAKAEVFLVTVEPVGGDGHPKPNTHTGQEFNFVLSGTLKVFIDEHEIVLEEGDFLFFDSSAAHAMKALGDRPARLLAAVI